MKRLASLGILVTTVAMLSAVQIVYALVGASPTESLARLTSFALALACALWIVADAQSRRQTPCFDFGFLVAVFFPISVVWYVFWSRGLRGFLLLARSPGSCLCPRSVHSSPGFSGTCSFEARTESTLLGFHPATISVFEQTSFWIDYFWLTSSDAVSADAIRGVAPELDEPISFSLAGDYSLVLCIGA